MIDLCKEQIFLHKTAPGKYDDVIIFCEQITKSGESDVIFIIQTVN